MKIIYVHQYFVTPQEGGATRSYHLAKGMVQHGIEVDMITSHDKSYYDLRIIDGIRVHYLPVSYRQQFGFFKRILAFFLFVNAAKKCIRKLQRPDLFYITSTPLTTGLIGLWAKRKLATPFIFEVRDLWPEAPIQLGVLNARLLKKAATHLEHRIYRHALKIIALSPGIAESIRKKSPSSNISIIPNFADLDTFFPMEKNSSTLQKFGLKNTFTIAYAGAVGKVNAVEEMLEIGKMAKERQKDFQFVVMGEGSELPTLKEKSKKMGLTNFVFLAFGDKKQVNELLSCADMAFVSFSHFPVLKTNSPNKFFDALAAGKAILINHKGWVHDLVKAENLGIYFPPHKISENFDKLVQLSENLEALQSIQSRSRNLAQRYFSKETAIKRLLSVIDEKHYGKITEDGVYILTA